MGVPEVVQPDCRESLLPQRRAHLHDLAGEPPRVPLGVAVRAAEMAQHERGVPHELVHEGTASRVVDPQGGDRVGVDVRHACLAGSSVPRRAAGRRPWP